MRGSRGKYLGEMDKDNPDLQKIGWASRRVASIALVLTGVFGPGMFLGWRDARADQARLERTQQELAATERTLKQDNTAFDNYLSRLDVACRSIVELYIHTDTGPTFSEIEAEGLVVSSGSCNNEGLKSPYELNIRGLNNSIEHDIMEINQEHQELAGRRRDASNNYELLQGGFAGAIVTAAALLLIGNVSDSRKRTD